MKFLILVTMMVCMMVAATKGSASGSLKESIMLSVDLDMDQGMIVDSDSSQVIIGQEQYQVPECLNISVPVQAYRGKTLKRTLYLWIEDGKGTRISTKAKASLPDRFKIYNLTMDLTFEDCRESAKYILVVEGIDADASKEIYLDFEDCSIIDGVGDGVGEFASLQDIGKGGISFSVIDYPDEVSAGERFTTRVLMTNPTDAYLEVDVWSYVYRSSVSYSGDREQNMKRINLPAFSNVTFDLENVVDASDGEYSFKLKFLRSDRKTSEDITLPIRVIEAGSEDTIAQTKNAVSEYPDARSGAGTQADSTARRTLIDSDVTGGEGSVVYQSSSAKARWLIPYLLIALLIILLVVLVLKRL
ncbi:MAG: hypothetical protein V1729_02790 [Candidatus Woesearchaeota archaeon]